MDSLFFGLLIALILGAYGWATLVYSWCRSSFRELWESFDKLKDNDFRHLEERVQALEDDARL